MTRRKHLRRIAILCLYCLRHLAYYRAGRKNDGSLKLHSQFWVAVNGNFLDICVLEWCKLFGDTRGKHYWKKGVSNPTAFNNDLLQNLEMSEAAFNSYVTEMRTYRDKYVAHLDSNERFDIPKLDITKDSAIFLYNYLLDNEDEGGFFNYGPADADIFYENVLKEGQAVYYNYIGKEHPL
jgi:hypothetical protein